MFEPGQAKETARNGVLLSVGIVAVVMVLGFASGACRTGRALPAPPRAGAGETASVERLLTRPVRLDVTNVTIDVVQESLASQIGEDAWRLHIVGTIPWGTRVRHDGPKDQRWQEIARSHRYVSRINLQHEGTLSSALDALVRAQPALHWQANSRGIFIDRPLPVRDREQLLTTWVQKTKISGSPATADSDNDRQFWKALCEVDDLALFRSMLVHLSNESVPVERFYSVLGRRGSMGPCLMFMPAEACKPWVPFVWDPRVTADIHALVDDPEVRAAVTVFCRRNLTAAVASANDNRIGRNLALMFSSIFALPETEADARRICMELLPKGGTPIAGWNPYGDSTPFLVLASFGQATDGELMRRAGNAGLTNSKNVQEEWARAVQARRAASPVCP